jgi:hypothetical protein
MVLPKKLKIHKFSCLKSSLEAHGFSSNANVMDKEEKQNDVLPNFLQL